MTEESKMTPPSLYEKRGGGDKGFTWVFCTLIWLSRGGTLCDVRSIFCRLPTLCSNVPLSANGFSSSYAFLCLSRHLFVVVSAAVKYFTVMKLILWCLPVNDRCFHRRLLSKSALLPWTFSPNVCAAFLAARYKLLIWLPLFFVLQQHIMAAASTYTL